MMQLAATMDGWGRALVSWLGAMNQWTLGLLAGALALDQLLARRVSASWRVALYAPLALRLVLPPGWTLSFAHASRVVTVLAPVQFDALASSSTHAASTASAGWGAIAFAVYVVVAAALAVVVVRRRLATSRLLRACRPVSDLAAMASPWPLVEHPHVGPMVVGTLSPRIVLPARLVATADEFALASVVRHEVAHLRRRDPWLAVAMQAVLVVAWPVVPLWVASWKVRQLMELACDELALRSAGEDERLRYGHALLDLAQWRSVPLTPAGAELHFGSTLRARIEALASQRRWPRALQVGLVGISVAAFAACSSVGPSPQGASPRADERAATKITTWDDIRHRCPSFEDRFAGWSDPATEWKTGPVDGIPASEIAYCRGPEVLANIDDALWEIEGRNVLGQMAKDLAAAWERDLARGKYELCPSDGPIPGIASPRGQLYQPNRADWSHPGFSCMDFGMDRPMSFQYTMRNDARGFVLTAYGQRPKGDHGVELTLVLRGEIRADHALNIAPNIEETWNEVQ